METAAVHSPILPIRVTASLFALLLVALPPPARTQDAAAFQRCLAAMQPQAAARGIDAASFARLTAGLQPDPTVLPLLDAQPEFTTPVWDYLAGLVDEQRVAVAVDAVVEVMRLDAREVSAPPALVRGLAAKFLDGILTRGERTILLLNARRLFTSREKAALTRSAP